MAWERRTPVVLAACGLVHWLVSACSGDAFSGRPGGEAGSGAAGGGGAATQASGGSIAGSGGTNHGGKPAVAGSAGAALGGAGATSTDGGSAPQGEAGEASGGMAATSPSIPSDALLFWFKSDAGVGTAQGVNRWADQSGNGFDAVQEIVDYQPRLAKIELLPLPVLVFDGTNDMLELPEFTQSFDSGLSFFAVAGRGQESDCSAMLELSNGSEVNDIFVGSVGSSLQFEIQSDVHQAPADAWPLAQVKLLEVALSADPVQAVAELRVDGAAVSTMVMQHPVAVTRTMNFIGRTLYANCSPSFAGAIAEIIMYARELSEEERVSVETYLTDKWQCCE